MGRAGRADPSSGIRLQNGLAFLPCCCHGVAGWTPFEGRAQHRAASDAPVQSSAHCRSSLGTFRHKPRHACGRVQLGARAAATAHVRKHQLTCGLLERRSAGRWPPGLRSRFQGFCLAGEKGLLRAMPSFPPVRNILSSSGHQLDSLNLAAEGTISCFTQHGKSRQQPTE